MSSNSKSYVHKSNGKTGPAGSYKTVSNWLVSQSTKELDNVIAWLHLIIIRLLANPGM